MSSMATHQPWTVIRTTAPKQMMQSRMPINPHHSRRGSSRYESAEERDATVNAHAPGFGTEGQGPDIGRTLIRVAKRIGPIAWHGLIAVHGRTVGLQAQVERNLVGGESDDIIGGRGGSSNHIAIGVGSEGSVIEFRSIAFKELRSLRE